MADFNVYQFTVSFRLAAPANVAAEHIASCVQANVALGLKLLEKHNVSVGEFTVNHFQRKEPTHG